MKTQDPYEEFPSIDPCREAVRLKQGLGLPHASKAVPKPRSINGFATAWLSAWTAVSS